MLFEYHNNIVIILSRCVVGLGNCLLFMQCLIKEIERWIYGERVGEERIRTTENKVGDKEGVKRGRTRRKVRRDGDRSTTTQGK